MAIFSRMFSAVQPLSQPREDGECICLNLDRTGSTKGLLVVPLGKLQPDTRKELKDACAGLPTFTTLKNQLNMSGRQMWVDWETILTILPAAYHDYVFEYLWKPTAGTVTNDNEWNA